MHRHAVMKYVWRFLLCVWIGACVVGPGMWMCCAEHAVAQSVQRVISRTSSNALPWFRLRPELASSLSSSSFKPEKRTSASDTKLRFTPVRIRGPERIIAAVTKELPHVSRTFDQKQRLPEPPGSDTRFGVRVELEAGYGDHETLVGYLRHGAQFQGAHYALTGHWERTQNTIPDKREENITTRLTCNIDLTDASSIMLDGGYTQSQVALPQLPGNASHIKSAIQTQAGYQANLTPTLYTAFTASWEDADFRDEHDIESAMMKYGGQFTLRKNWSGKNTLSVEANGGWEQLSQAQTTRATRYYASAALLNSFAMYDRFSLDTGVQLDYYHSEQVPHTNYHIAPIITARWQLFQNTSWYAEYHPRLKIPDFTDLYIRKLYTTVNPELHSEKQQHYIEVGFKQRVGEAFVVNVGGFYHESQDFIVQIDTNADHILEYDHMSSVDFLGVRANVQMNYRERLVQNITYTYTTHSIFSEQHASPSGDDFRNQILPYQPNHQVQAGLAWTLPLGLTIDVDGLYVSEQYRNRSKEQPPIGRRFFVNIEARQRISENISLFVAGRNVTDISTYDIIPWLNSEDITSSRLFLGGIRVRF